jgi:hypothetical protein
LWKESNGDTNRRRFWGQKRRRRRRKKKNDRYDDGLIRPRALMDEGESHWLHIAPSSRCFLLRFNHHYLIVG